MTRPDIYISTDEIAHRLGVPRELVVAANTQGAFTKSPQTGNIIRLQFEREGWTAENIESRTEAARGKGNFFTTLAGIIVIVASGTLFYWALQTFAA